MKTKPSSEQVLHAREYLVHCVKRSGAVLLTNVPMAMSGQPNSVRLAYAIITLAAVALHLATGAGVWVVRVKL